MIYAIILLSSWPFRTLPEHLRVKQKQIRIQIRSTKISLIGVVAGIGVSIYKFEQLWWVLLILLGVLGVTSMQLLGMIQKRNILENIEKLNKEVNDNV